MSINTVAISGNLTRDPQIKANRAGTAVLQFGVAVNDRRRNAASGEWEDYANFVDCVMFGSRAESVAKHLSKGSKVSILGKLRWTQWQDRETGQNRSKLEVIVEDIDFMSARQDTRPGRGQEYRQTAQQPAYAPMPQQPVPMPAPQQIAPQAAPQQAQMPMPQQPMPQGFAQQAEANQPEGAYDSEIPF